MKIEVNWIKLHNKNLRRINWIDKHGILLNLEIKNDLNWIHTKWFVQRDLTIKKKVIQKSWIWFTN